MIFILIPLLVFGRTVQAEDEPEQLYAQSAVLMDADSGRVLFEKNGEDRKAMASTTKIMTCILALEYGNEDMVITFSDEAKKQPKVHLGASEGEQFYLKDLLYSLMLESHNDSAVAIAEGVSGTVESFAELMNQKAKNIGCNDTYFITPNGLDASDQNGAHSTTAIDLAKIMSYCINESPKKERFLEITSASQYGFSNVEGSRTYSCSNHNAFLNMMKGAISGKTGFTSEAGYCYVGAVKSEGRIFVVSLLACGWPNNKNYKWIDMKKLIAYGMKNYKLETLDMNLKLEEIQVGRGIPKSGDLFKEAFVKVAIKGENEHSVLVKDDENIEIKIEQKKQLVAPIERGDRVGNVTYYLDGKQIAQFPVVSQDTVEKKDFAWCFCKIAELYAL